MVILQFRAKLLFHKPFHYQHIDMHFNAAYLLYTFEIRIIKTDFFNNEKKKRIKNYASVLLQQS